jgi:hypothetical protein
MVDFSYDPVEALGEGNAIIPTQEKEIGVWKENHEAQVSPKVFLQNYGLER